MESKTWINLIVVSGLLVASFGVMPITAPTVLAAMIIRVKPGGGTSFPCGDGWANACELQTALTNASAGDEIWAAAGTYKPGTNREDTFQLISGVTLYGGFAGTEISREQRDWEANPTVLSGDIGSETDMSDNSYHVVTGSGVDVMTLLNGFTVTGGNADGDYPANYGGGMYNYGGNPSVVNVTFSGNSAAGFGGGLYTYESNIGMSNVIFTGNSATSGGGMYAGYGSPKTFYLTFSDNSAGDRGGGLYNSESEMNIFHATFSGNSAGVGGGLYNDGNTNLLGVAFSNNSAISGGGMYNDRSSTMTAVIFSGNQVTDRGGGMVNTEFTKPFMAKVSFSGNTAGNYGGGMYNEFSNPKLNSVSLSGNGAGMRGGGMFNEQSSPKLTNVTLSGNYASTEGGGMFNASSSASTIANTILWGNTAGSNDSQIYNDQTSTSSIRYSDVQGGCATIAGDDCSGGGNIDADPLFVRNPDPGADGTWGTADDDYGNLRLQNGSPAIDAGDNTAPGLAGITMDLDGNLRFEDIPGVGDTGVGPPPVVDMGAYEAVNFAPVAKDDGYTTAEDVPLHVSTPGILVNDSDPNSDPLTTAVESEPSSGSLDFHPDGSFDYLPDRDYFGEVTFTYHSTDGLLASNTSTVTITISNVNDAPVAVKDAYADNENVLLSINAPGVLENDSDPDGDLLTAVLENGPSSGSLDLSTDGSFDYMPQTDFSGVVTFTYQATDGLLDSNIATVTITINGAPIAANDTYATDENVTLTINVPGVLQNDSDPNGDPLSAVLESGPSSGSLTLNPDGSFIYLPEKGYAGAVTFAYHATDGLLDSNTAMVTITIIDVWKEVYLPMIIR